MEYINLVNLEGKRVGKVEKIKAHKEKKLHLAFSILVFNEKKEMLIHKRSLNKYHSPGLWTNTCCSHPKFGESLENATHRRLKEEMGFDCEMKKIFDFIYKKEFENGLTEYEFDNVYIGKYNGESIKPDENEVFEYKWIDYNELIRDISKNPKKFTVWFKKIIEIIENKNINIFGG
ncbi:MAG: isopentenyl-diphosphate Delta-isomerase [Bacillota bacterium]